MRKEKPIKLSFTNATALVLFEWISRSHETQQFHVTNTAEKYALWDLEGQLELQLTEPFSPHYDKLLAEAREKAVTEAENVSEVSPRDE